ncbi:MAG: hypothetical protein FWH03_02660 [Firmicutes bacterium]|nr:hypothetical protein [Bacillota bacterium]
MGVFAQFALGVSIAAIIIGASFVAVFVVRKKAEDIDVCKTLKMWLKNLLILFCICVALAVIFTILHFAI